MGMRLFCTQLQDVLTWNSGFPAMKWQRGLQKSTSASTGYAVLMRPNKAQTAVHEPDTFPGDMVGRMHAVMTKTPCF